MGNWIDPYLSPYAALLTRPPPCYLFLLLQLLLAFALPLSFSFSLSSLTPSSALSYTNAHCAKPDQRFKVLWCTVTTNESSPKRSPVSLSRLHFHRCPNDRYLLAISLNGYHNIDKKSIHQYIVRMILTYFQGYGNSLRMKFKTIAMENDSGIFQFSIANKSWLVRNWWYTMTLFTCKSILRAYFPITILGLWESLKVIYCFHFFQDKNFH